MVPVEDTTVYRSTADPKAVKPIVGPFGLQMMSFGHVSPKAGVVGAGGKQAAVIRGPIVSRVINQLIASTEWGKLDYLVVDMPPGTGDIQITLSQSISLSGAVVVSTPHLLSVADAIKGVEMFADLHVPTLALVC
jgi:ATP-binding protein involved in chromosome partitioning